MTDSRIGADDDDEDGVAPRFLRRRSFAGWRWGDAVLCATLFFCFHFRSASGAADARIESQAGRDIRLTCGFLDKIYSGEYEATWIVEWKKNAEKVSSSPESQLYVAIWKKSTSSAEREWSRISAQLSANQRVNESTLALTLVDPRVGDTGIYECRTKFDVYNATDPKQNLGYFSVVYNVTIQDAPDRLGQPEVKEKSSRSVKLRRHGDLVPNFSEIRRLVVEVEEPDNNTYEMPFSNMSAVLQSEPYLLLTRLRPFTRYRFRVTAVNKIGRGPWSDWSLPVVTDEEAPEGKPNNFQLGERNMTSLQVTWQAPSPRTLNGELKDFEIMWKKGKDDPKGMGCKEAPPGGVERNTTVKASASKQFYSYWIPDLDVFTCYSIFVRARNSKGQGPPASTVGKTDESTPPKPSFVRADKPSHDYFNLTWSFKRESRRGILTKFLVQYRVSENDVAAARLPAPRTPDGAASSGAGPRDSSAGGESAVGDGIVWKERWKNCVAPDEIDYCNIQDVFKMQVDNLLPNTRYNYRVAAFTSKGRGDFSVTYSLITEPRPPSKPLNLAVRKILVDDKPAVVVSWKIPDNGTVDKYRITVRDVTGRWDDKLLHLKLGCPVVMSSTASGRDRESCVSRDAVEKRAEPDKAFDLANVDYNYNVSSGHTVLFLNWTVPAKFTTLVAAAAESNNHQNQYNYGAAAPSGVLVVGLPGSEPPQDEPDVGKIVAVIVCAVIVILTIAVISVAFTRTRMPACFGLLNRKYHGTEYFDASGIQTPSINEVTSTIDSNIYQETDAPIPVADFAAYVHRGHANDNLGFAEDFEEVLATCRNLPPAKNSEDPQNQVKNRYLNIVAYDHTRVKLKPFNGSGGRTGDYINANYIDGYQKSKCYIASQGPIPSTFEDFWQMVWENNTCVIIMVTNLIERGRLKCDQYWPIEGTQVYGAFEVQLASTAALAHYTVRDLRLRHRSHKGSKHKHRGSGGGHHPHHQGGERLVRQFHFTEWPDHGTPNHTLPLLSFIRKSSASNPEGAGPMVVHCSAGVGRTGTYIVIDTMLKQIKDKETINIKGFLKYIRQQRNHLVQTEDQYVFTHDVLLEAIHSETTEVGVASIASYVEDLQSILLGSSSSSPETTRLEHQMDLVVAYAPDEYDLLNANKPVNAPKIRWRGLAPVEHARVTLAPKPGVDGSDFINASFIHSYKRDTTFIVTQHPMQTTIQDFWRLVWDYNVKTVVLLGSFKASNEFPMFWPDSEEETIKGDQFKVAFREREEVRLCRTGPALGVGMDFILQANQDDYELCTRIFYFPGWGRGLSHHHHPSTTANGGVVNGYDEPSNNPASSAAAAATSPATVGPALLEYVDQVGLWHVDHPSNFVVVVDPLGGTEAATFCALSTLQEQMRAEQTVDVYQVAALYHFKRPGIWGNITDYHFLYQAIKTVAHQFEAPKRPHGVALTKTASSLSAGYDYLRHSPRLLRSASSRLGASLRGNHHLRGASSPRDSPSMPVRAVSSGLTGQDFSIGAPSDSTPKTSHTSLARESPATPPHQGNHIGPTSNYSCDQNSNTSSKGGTPQSHHSSNGFFDGYKSSPNPLLNGPSGSPPPPPATIIPPPPAPTQPLSPSAPLIVGDGTDAYFRSGAASSRNGSCDKVYHETEM